MKICSLNMAVRDRIFYHVSGTDELSLSELRIPSIINTTFNKPGGGFWCCEGPEWYDWCQSEEFGVGSFVYQIELKSTANFLVLESLEDYESIYLKFPYGGYSETLMGEIELFKDNMFLDYVSIARNFDGLFMGSGLVYRYRNDPRLYLSAWDVPSLVIFNKTCIQSLNLLGEF